MTIQEGSSPKAFLILAILFALGVGTIVYAIRSSSSGSLTTSTATNPIQTKTETKTDIKPEAENGIFKSITNTIGELAKLKDTAENMAKNAQKTAEKAAENMALPPALPTVAIPNPKISGDATGQEIYNSYGCATCHMNNGKGIGPSLVGIFGQQRSCRGKKITVDERYLQLVMIDPNACNENPRKQSIMPSYSGVINPDRRFAIAKYIKTLK